MLFKISSTIYISELSRSQTVRQISHFFLIDYAVKPEQRENLDSQVSRSRLLIEISKLIIEHSVCLHHLNVVMLLIPGIIDRSLCRHIDRVVNRLDISAYLDHTYILIDLVGRAGHTYMGPRIAQKLGPQSEVVRVIVQQEV